MTEKMKKTILMCLYGALFVFGFIMIKNIAQGNASFMGQNHKIYKEYEFPERYYVWVSNDRLPEGSKQNYVFQRNNKKVRIESGSKIIILRKEGLSYFNTKSEDGILKVAFSYKLKPGFVSGADSNRINWFNDFRQDGITYAIGTSNINQIRFWEVLGGTTRKLTYDVPRRANYDLKTLTEAEVWAKQKNIVRKAINAHALVVTNVAFFEANRGDMKYYAQDSDYDEDDYLAQSYPDKVPDDLKGVINKIMADESELNSMYNNMQNQKLKAKVKNIEKDNARQERMNKKSRERAFEK